MVFGERPDPAARPARWDRRGGYLNDGNWEPDAVLVASSYPSDPSTWSLTVKLFPGTDYAAIIPYAVCVRP